MSDSIQHAYEETRVRLESVKKRDNLALLVHGSLLCISGFLLAVLFGMLLETFVRIGVIGRTVLFWVPIAVALFLFIRRVIRPLLTLLGLLKPQSDLAVADRLAFRVPAVKDRLLNALQLLTSPRERRLYSTEFIDAAFLDTKKEIDLIDFSSVTDFSSAKRMARVFAGIVVGGLFLFLLFPSTFFGAADRLWNHSQFYTEPALFKFIVEPGNREVIKGENVQIVVRVEGEQQKQIILASKPKNQVQYDQVELEPSADGTFRHEFESLKLSTDYYASASEVRSEEYLLQVVDRPVVRLLRLNLIPPRYSALAQRQLDDHVGDVLALKGTKIKLFVEANKPLVEAVLVFDDGTESAMAVEDAEANGELTLTREASYHIRLRDDEGLTNADPIRYSLKILPDAPPRVSIEVPGRNLDVTGSEQLNMIFRLTDDYGFTRLRLAHRLVHSKYEAPSQEFTNTDIPLPSGLRAEGSASHLWDLRSLSLVPEDLVAYHVEVFDNDNISGPKSGRSEEYTLRLPSLEEVFADIDEGHDITEETLREAQSEAQEARKELEVLEQEMKKNQQKMDWQEKKKAEEIIEKYREVQKKIDTVSETLEQMIDKMQKNEMLSQETLEKYLELQQLMEELNSSELGEVLKRLQEALRQLNPEALQKAMQQFTFSEEQFRKNLERTINLLKRIQIEQKVDEAITRTEELSKQQSELQEETEQSDGADSKKLSDRQRELKEEVDRLKKQLEELQSMMEEFPGEMPLEEMEEVLAGLDSSALGKQMEQISNQLAEQQMNEAMKGQQQALQCMGQFMDQLRKMQEQLRQNQQQQVANELRKAYRDILELSSREERLKEESAGLQQNSPLFRENAARQMEVMADLGRVAERLAMAAQKTFGVTPEMGKAVGDAMQSMRSAMQSLDQRSSTSAGEHQENAMASLNEAAQHLQGALNAMMEAGSQGMGMAGLMQRLQGITGMQQGINRGTQHLGGLGQQQAAEMARLAGEQGMVRKSLEQLAREASRGGELSKLLGDLNRVAKDMREVQTDLAQGNVQPETIRKQERILSRLLDSQRSMRERDYEKRRRAESGKDYARINPPRPTLATKDDQNRLRRDLLKALEEGYAKDYQTLIKKYFDLLENQVQDKPD